MEIKELEIYKDRLQKEYYDLLSYREGILQEIELNEKELEQAQAKKIEVLKLFNSAFLISIC